MRIKNRALIFLITVLLMACETKQDFTIEVQDYLGYTFSKQPIACHIKKIEKSHDYLLPFRTYIRIDADSIEFKKIVSFFRLKTFDVITRDSIYTNNEDFFKHFPLLAYTDSTIYNTVNELKSEMTWWDIEIDSSLATYINFIDVSQQSHISLLDDKSIRKPNQAIGKMICQYKNRAIYICIGNL